MCFSVLTLKMPISKLLKIIAINEALTCFFIQFNRVHAIDCKYTNKQAKYKHNYVLQQNLHTSSIDDPTSQCNEQLQSNNIVMFTIFLI